MPDPAPPDPVSTANPQLERLIAEREHLYEMCDRIAAEAAAEERDPSEAENSLVDGNRERIVGLDSQIDRWLGLEESRSRHRTVAVVTRRPIATSVPLEPAGPGAPMVYRTFGQYARDVLIQRFEPIRQRAGAGAGDAATERLQRQAANTVSADVPGLIPPQHIAQIMQNIATGRPAVSLARQVPLTSGKLTYPRINTRPVTAKQAAEKTLAGNIKMAVSMEDVVAETFLGAGDLSWQAINWSTPDALTLWFDLCAESYAGQTEAAFLANVTTQTTAAVPVATDDLEGWMAAIAAAAGTIFEATKYGGNVGRFPNAVVFDPATGFKLFGIVSQANPVFLALGTANLATGTGPNLGGLGYVISGAATVPIVGFWPSALVGETPGAPVELRAVEPSIGGMEVGLIGAFASEVVEVGAFCELTPPVPGP